MPMQIMVQAFSDGKTQIVSVEPNDKLSVAFQKISDQRGIEKQYLKLVYAGKEFRHDDTSVINKTIADLGMRDRSIIQVVTRQPGGRHNLNIDIAYFKEILTVH